MRGVVHPSSFEVSNVEITWVVEVKKNTDQKSSIFQYTITIKHNDDEVFETHAIDIVSARGLVASYFAGYANKTLA